MMQNGTAIVTGCAGFIGAHLCEKLVALDYEVIGIDSFTDYYPRSFKLKNLENLRANAKKSFKLIEADITELDLDQLITSDTYIFHLAAQPGVRASWGSKFEIYVKDNILATQRLLEAVKSKPIRKFIYVSSSSVYGDCKELPMREDAKLEPISPYGMSKLAGEHLCRLYYKNYKVPVVILRYFTVYGPRQRPDMGFHKFIKAGLEATPVIIYGDGNQTRDFTYIADIVSATISAITKARDGEIYNIGGGSNLTINNVLELIETILNTELERKYYKRAKGDVRDTLADISKAERELDYQPTVDIKTGLVAEVNWLRELLKDTNFSSMNDSRYNE